MSWQKEVWLNCSFGSFGQSIHAVLRVYHCMFMCVHHAMYVRVCLLVLAALKLVQLPHNVRVCSHTSRRTLRSEMGAQRPYLHTQSLHPNTSQ